MRRNDGKSHFSEKEKGKVWKDYMVRILNEENGRDHNIVGDERRVQWSVYADMRWCYRHCMN